jgi:hypothetical protein
MIASPDIPLHFFRFHAITASEAVIWFPSMPLYPHQPKQWSAPALRLSPKAWQLKG